MYKLFTANAVLLTKFPWIYKSISCIRKILLAVFPCISSWRSASSINKTELPLYRFTFFKKFNYRTVRSDYYFSGFQAKKTSHMGLINAVGVTESNGWYQDQSAVADWVRNSVCASRWGAQFRNFLRNVSNPLDNQIPLEVLCPNDINADGWHYNKKRAVLDVMENNVHANKRPVYCKEVSDCFVTWWPLAGPLF